MHRIFVASIIGAALLATPVLAHAQDADSPIAGEVTTVEGNGYPVGEGTVIHPTLGAELGFTDNVFYQDTTVGRDASGILRLIAEAAIASKTIKPDEGTADPDLDPTAEEPAPPAEQKVTYRAGGKLAYEEYLSPTDFVRSQRNLAADLAGDVVIAPAGTVSFGASDHFTRDTHPTNFESTSGTNRIANAMAMELKYQPGGRQLTGSVRWENQLDLFETSTQQFGNRMQNTLHARSEWMFFPFSKVFADVSYGFINSLGSSGASRSKQGANPIRGGIGVATVITEVFTVKAHIGWAYAGYADGIGYNQPLIGTELGYRYSPLGRIVFSYDYGVQDSINADFYRDHAFILRIDHQFGKLLSSAHGDLRLRHYDGIDPSIGSGTDRSDTIVAVGADLQWLFRDSLAAVVNYRTEIDTTNYMTTITTPDNPGYVRTEVTAGVRAAF